ELSRAQRKKTTAATAIGTVASPIAARQPNAAASRGMKSAASTVPEFPAPAIPMARPWCSGGYQRETSGSATAKLAPGTPSSTATVKRRPRESAKSPPRRAEQHPAGPRVEGRAVTGALEARALGRPEHGAAEVGAAPVERHHGAGIEPDHEDLAPIVGGP